MQTDDSTGQASASSASESWRQTLQRLAGEVALREGCEIYDIEFLGQVGGRILRVYIDKAATDGAAPAHVSVDDCSNVSRGLNLLLDVEDIVPGGAYHLEVSSPGLERPLRTARHFERAVGQRVQVKTFEPMADLDSTLEEAARQKLGKAKQLEATLIASDGSTLKLDVENGGHVIRVCVPFDKVTKANTVFDFKKNEKPTGGSKKKR